MWKLRHEERRHNDCNEAKRQTNGGGDGQRGTAVGCSDRAVGWSVVSQSVGVWSATELSEWVSEWTWIDRSTQQTPSSETSCHRIASRRVASSNTLRHSTEPDSVITSPSHNAPPPPPPPAPPHSWDREPGVCVDAGDGTDRLRHDFMPHTSRPQTTQHAPCRCITKAVWRKKCFYKPFNSI